MVGPRAESVQFVVSLQNGIRALLLFQGTRHPPVQAGDAAALLMHPCRGAGTAVGSHPLCSLGARLGVGQLGTGQLAWGPGEGIRALSGPPVPS